jgi:hypothetical protein
MMVIFNLASFRSVADQAVLRPAVTDLAQSETHHIRLSQVERMTVSAKPLEDLYRPGGSTLFSTFVEAARIKRPKMITNVDERF